MATTAVPHSPYLTFLERPHQLEVIDQRKLPLTEVKIKLRSVEDVWTAIENMTVRGAPLIGICGAFGMAIAGETNDDLDSVKKYLDSARPTAVNLMWATSRMLAFGKKSKENRSLMFEEAKRIAHEEFYACERMAELGAALIPKSPREGQTTVNVIHHCNTGGLATYGVGTALGCLTRRAKKSPNLFVWVDETRPRLQGAKLTSWELNRDKVPNKVIADGAAGFVLLTGRADCVFFGADRIVANGDVVNKIGTYSLSVVAKENGVPVYCVAPTSTIDLTIPTGSAVKIEERGDDEVFEFEGKRFVDKDSKAFNPAFDATPSRYITAIITEEGVCYPPFRESLAAAKARAYAKQHGMAVDPESPAAVEKVLEASGVKKTSTAERLFAVQNDPIEEKRVYHREDPRAVKPKTYLGDGSDTPEVAEQTNTEPRFAKAKTYLGDGSDGAVVDNSAKSNVRIFGDVRKSSILLSDDAQPNASKSSIRVTKTKQTSLFPDDGDHPRKQRADPKANLAQETTRDEELLTQPDDQQPSSPDPNLFSKLQISEQTTSTGKAHIEPPQPPEERVMSKAHLSPPSPERPTHPKSKGFLSPAKQSSNIFG